MHRLVFTMIVTLSADLLSLRLSGVLEVGTSIGQGCSTIVGEDLSIAFVCLESGDREQTCPGLWFLPVWYGGIPDSLLLSFCVASAGRSRPSLLYSLAFVGLAVWGFLTFLVFSAPFFSNLFLWTS